MRERLGLREQSSRILDQAMPRAIALAENPKCGHGLVAGARVNGIPGVGINGDGKGPELAKRHGIPFDEGATLDQIGNSFEVGERRVVLRTWGRVSAGRRCSSWDDSDRRCPSSRPESGSERRARRPPSDRVVRHVRACGRRRTRRADAETEYTVVGESARPSEDRLWLLARRRPPAPHRSRWQARSHALGHAGQHEVTRTRKSYRIATSCQGRA